MPVLGGVGERIGEIVEVEVVRVGLRRVGAAVAHQTLQSDEVSAALADEAVCEAVPQLVGGKATNACALADACRHSPERLFAGRRLRILAASFALALVDPDLDLDCEHVIVRLGLQLPEALAQLVEDVRIDGEPVPVSPLALYAHASPEEIDVFPAAAEHFGAAQPCAFHQEDRWPLMAHCGIADPLQFVKAWPVDVGLALWRPADLP